MIYLSPILAAFSILASPLLAKSYTVTPAGDHWLVAPSSHRIHLQPWNAEPKPACAELFNTLRRNSATIDRCLPGASQPQTACKLLKTILPEAIFGAEDPSSGVAEDVEQYFAIDQSDFETIPDLASIAQTENLPLAKLTIVTQTPWPSALLGQSVKIVGGTESYIPKLSQLEYLKDFVGQVTVGTDGSYGVRDRLSYCELVDGRSNLQGRGSYKVRVKVPIAAAALDWVYSLHQRLSALSYPLPGTLEQQALTIGYEIGQFSIQNQLKEGTSISALDLYRLFFEKKGNALQVRAFTKEQLQQSFTKVLEADITTSFQSYN